ncbi:MAG: type II CRISPR RNA-guided endonuclease Cas9 [Fusobacteria bacterium]|nr:type II CRISPR RNA-guided endonuclease Cas9 [Fusobacteriota bacterium]
MKYKIGLDLGIASCGWCVINNDEDRIEDLGVRIFTSAENPKDGGALAVPRREARSARRRNRRRKFRMHRIKQLLIRKNLTTKEQLESSVKGLLSPWELRKEVLSRIVTGEELAKILVHIAKRRGYQSNRKSDERDVTNDSGKVISGIKEMREVLQEKGYQTVGEMFAVDEKFHEHKRNKGGSYAFSVDRKMLLDEISQIFQIQRELGNPLATNELEEKFVEVFKSQRNFADGPGISGYTKEGEIIFSPFGGDQIEKMMGRCAHFKEEPRAVKNAYSSELSILFQKINQLKIGRGHDKRHLLAEERELLVKEAHEKKELKYAQIRKWLNLTEDERFNLLSYGRKSNEEIEKAKFCELKGYQETKKAIEKVSKSYFETIKENRELLDDIAYAVTVYKSDEKIIEKLSKYSIPNDILDEILLLSFSKTSNLSIKALKMIEPYLQEGCMYHEACEMAEINHTKNQQGDKFDILPVISKEEVINPVVLRSLSQTRKVVNGIIRKYGTPDTIHIELARELSKNFKDRQDIIKEQKKNQDKNEKAKADLIERYGLKTPTGGDILKSRLFDEQDAKCFYSFNTIDRNRLFEKGYVEIDHILPYSQTFDDSYNNKVLVLAQENQHKRNRTAHEYVESKGGEFLHKYEEIIKGTYKISSTKRDNLLKGKLTQEDMEGFKERNLSDTKYITRFMKNFLENNLEFSSKSNSLKVYTVKGALTAKLRGIWGITKIRSESDIHHAIDAAVVAVATKSAEHFVENLQKLSVKSVNLKTGEYFENSKDLETYRMAELKMKIPQPWAHFRDELEYRVAENGIEALKNEATRSYMKYSQEFVNTLKPIFVSRMPNHKVTGPAHQETYRSSKHLQDEKSTVKTPLTKLTFKNIDDIANAESDTLLVNALKVRLEEYSGDGVKAFAKAFYKPKSDGSQGPLVRSVKLLSVQKGGVPVLKGDAIADRASMVRIDIFSKKNAKGKEQFYIVPIYVADTVKKELPNNAIVANKSHSEWIEMDAEYGFKFSLYPNDLVRLEMKEEKNFYYYKGVDVSTGAISLDDILGRLEKDTRKGIKSPEKFEKWGVDALGNIAKIKNEKRLSFR